MGKGTQGKVVVKSSSEAHYAQKPIRNANSQAPKAKDAQIPRHRNRDE
jgi:hypothetical protein